MKSKIRQTNYNLEKIFQNTNYLAPIPDPNKIICLAFNYVDHAKEQGLQAPDNPALVIKPRTST